MLLVLVTEKPSELINVNYVISVCTLLVHIGVYAGGASIVQNTN